MYEMWTLTVRSFGPLPLAIRLSTASSSKVASLSPLVSPDVMTSDPAAHQLFFTLQSFSDFTSKSLGAGKIIES